MDLIAIAEGTLQFNWMDCNKHNLKDEYKLASQIRLTVLTHIPFGNQQVKFVSESKNCKCHVSCLSNTNGTDIA